MIGGGKEGPERGVESIDLLPAVALASVVIQLFVTVAVAAGAVSSGGGGLRIEGGRTAFRLKRSTADDVPALLED